MKKFLSLATAFMLTVAMAVPAFAAGSPSSTPAASDATDASGSKIEVVVVALPEAVVTEVAAIVKDETTLVAEAVKSGVIADSNYKAEGILASGEIELKNGVTPSESNPVTITFEVNTAKAGDTIVAAHKKENGDWEYLPTTVVNGKVTVKFTSLSPIVFIKLAPTTGDTSDEDTSDTTSPATGDVIYLVELLAAAALAGGIVCAKRARR